MELCGKAGEGSKGISNSKLCTYILTNALTFTCHPPQVFKDATLFALRDDMTITSFIPAMDTIDDILSTNLTAHKIPPTLRAALNLGKKTLNRYYSKTDNSEAYRIMMGEFGLICVIAVVL